MGTVFEPKRIDTTFCNSIIRIKEVITMNTLILLFGCALIGAGIAWILGGIFNYEANFNASLVGVGINVLALGLLFIRTKNLKW